MAAFVHSLQHDGGAVCEVQPQRSFSEVDLGLRATRQSEPHDQSPRESAGRNLSPVLAQIRDWMHGRGSWRGRPHPAAGQRTASVLRGGWLAGQRAPAVLVGLVLCRVALARHDGPAIVIEFAALA
eukprot:CAMPEP_0175437752 /NCGR_PEP_ID=MMETSP0095-20121207/55645_1 /TAXON_ID=311494 /ORGANISM="Alexandrium monilatum, Strain CCMP3105" /LENGTH=125 /DNA_ID=CAMNT_0016737461 /DNA_START=212 /DNA_END=585 /DNA_ORIENTATION=-